MANLKLDALIGKKLWEDTFTRTSETDWGSDWVVDYLSGSAIASVDGSAGHLTAGGKYYEGHFSSSKRVSYGYVQFDFWVPANASDPKPYFWISQGGEYPVGVEIYQGDGTTWYAGIYYYYAGSTDPYYPIVVSPSTWYRVKGVYNGIQEGILGVKIWKAADPEPAEFQATGTIGIGHPLTDPDDWFDVSFSFESPSAEPLGFDNLIFGDYGEPFSSAVFLSLTAGAIVKRTMSSGITANAVIGARSFSVGAWIIGGRSGHSRLLDHFGTQPDTYVILDGAISKYPSGSTVHTVLTDIVARLEALESGTHTASSFSMSAFIQPCLRADAVLRRTDINGTGFHFDAEIVGGKTNQPFTLNAVLIYKPSNSFLMSAYLIDLVC